MTVKKVFLIGVFVWMGLSSFAQDVIITKRGRTIYCEITRMDSLTFSYIKEGENRISHILRSDIKKFYLSPEYAIKRKDKPGGTLTTPPTKETFLISVNGGIANPVGHFGNNDALHDSLSGLAGPGFAAGVTAIYKLNKFLGLSLGYNYQSHPLNLELMKRQLTIANPGASFVADGGKWIVRGVFGGFYGVVKSRVEQHLSVDFNFALGLSTCVSPQLITTGVQNGKVVTISQESATGKTIAQLGGVGIHYEVVEGVFLGLNASYLYAYPSFTNIQLSSNAFPTRYFNAKQKITSVNMQLNITLLLH